MEVLRQKPDSKLNSFESEALLKWVDSFELSRCCKKLNRDFSDAVLLAEILKIEFPCLVDIHNYNGCFAVTEKKKNWEVLNRKVLKKLQFYLKPDDIEKLAKAETNYIDEILFRLMIKIKQIKSNTNSSLLSGSSDEQMSDIMTIKIVKQIGDHLEEIPQEMIKYSAYEEMMCKMEKQEEVIENMKMTIDDLQKQLSLKIQLIEDLQNQIDERESKKCAKFSIKSITQSFSNLL
ncbi:CLUMA_CG011401, isoform A [Clunio marinus]|uniref:CLUMA_CG011401, isoform A n=1 Tax=Clunio marinus TaxID=568069 RepID=A0A1J1ICS0_9DIPT|nr:CLUMA_CG011401, isoform A [Clunio marinus]